MEARLIFFPLYSFYIYNSYTRFALLFTCKQSHFPEQPIFACLTMKEFKLIDIAKQKQTTFATFNNV